MLNDLKKKTDNDNFWLTLSNRIFNIQDSCKKGGANTNNFDINSNVARKTGEESKTGKHGSQAARQVLLDDFEEISAEELKVEAKQQDYFEVEDVISPQLFDRKEESKQLLRATQESNDDMFIIDSPDEANNNRGSATDSFSSLE